MVAGGRQQVATVYCLLKTSLPIIHTSCNIHAMSLLMGLFNLFSLLYVFRSVQLAVNIGRNWTAVRQPPLTAQKKNLAEQAAFFIAVPPAVFVHELFHALAVWYFGGRVVEFGYRAFWGYVVPAGNFTPTQEWVIAIAGTIGSLLTGLLIWLALHRHSSMTLRFFGLRAFRFQMYFSLIYYPLFTLFLPIGDWRTIYDFAATPVLSGITAILHATALLTFWLLDRRGWFELPAAASATAANQFEALRATAEQNPQDLQLQLQAIDALRRGGATQQAQSRLRALLKQHPNLAAAHLLLAVVESDGRGQVSSSAANRAQQALQLGLADSSQIALAHQLIGRFHLERGKGQEAAEQFTQALEHSNSTIQANQLHLAQLHQQRSLAYRRLGQYDPAYQDIQQAIDYARAIGNVAAEKRYLDELEVLQMHADRRLSPFR